MNSLSFRCRKLIKNLSTFFLIPFLFFNLFFTAPDICIAASGGRIGGSNFTAPSIPRTRSYGESYGGSYGRGYRGGGIGFPFILPFFGFGGGGLFGLIVLIAISSSIVNTLRGANINPVSTNDPYRNQTLKNESVTMIQTQIGLLANAKTIQKQLRELASSSDTSTSKGLQLVLQDTTLALLRKPDLWVYSNIEIGSVPFQSAEATFNKLSITERSKLKAEITSNYGGIFLNDQASLVQPGDANDTSEYIAITILVATKGKLNLNTPNEVSELETALRSLGSISSAELIALEIIWQPEGEGEGLSSEELLTMHPNLKHL